MKKVINIYTEIEETANINADNGGCGTGCGTGSSCGGGAGGPSLEETLEEFNKKYSDLYEVIVVDINKLEKEAVMERINAALEQSGERLVLKPSNYDFVLPKLIPLITHENSILAVNTVPTEEELQGAIVSGQRIKAKSGCN